MRKLVGAWLFALLCCQCGTVIAAPQVGWWWNPNESGRGFFVESQNGVTFIGAYFYDDDGHATWLVAGGQNADPYNYSGPLYALKSGQTLFGSYVAPAGPETVGQMSVHFSDDTHGTFTWPGGAVAIERQIFGAGDAPFQPFNGWWWNPDESGSGYSVELQGDKLFIVGFMYDDSGRAVWYFSAGPMSSPTTYHGDVLQFANGQTMGGPYRPPSAPAKVATLDVEFTAMDQATLTFSEAGATLSSRAGGSSASAGRFGGDLTPAFIFPGQRITVVRPQLPKNGFYVLPAGFTGVINIDTKVHIPDDGDGTSDLHYVHRFTVTLMQSPDLTLGTYAEISGQVALTYDAFHAGSDGTCATHGEGTLSLAGIAPLGFYADVIANPSARYRLDFVLTPGYAAVDSTVTCTTSDGQIVTVPSKAAPGTDDFNYEGVIVGNHIGGGAIKSVTMDGITSTITVQWSLDAVH